MNEKFWKDMQGAEIWTNVLGERTCVGIDYPCIIDGGERHELTEEQWRILYDDYLMQEYGTTDTLEIMKMEGF